MEAASGSNVLNLAKDPPSASPYLPGDESKAQERFDAETLVALLVEDNPTDVFVIKEVLEASGFNLRVRVARDGQDALSYLEQLERNESLPCPALVLLDLNLPKVSGVEVLKQLRRGSRCNQTPVIIVTSSIADTDRDAVQQLGAEAYFQKPLELAAYARLGDLVKAVFGADEKG